MSYIVGSHDARLEAERSTDAGIGLLWRAAGGWLKRKVPLLDRRKTPGSIVGGLLYAVAALLLRDLPMVAFMTMIGLNSRLQLLREGGAGDLDARGS